MAVRFDPQLPHLISKRMTMALMWWTVNPAHQAERAGVSTRIRTHAPVDLLFPRKPVAVSVPVVLAGARGIILQPGWTLIEHHRRRPQARADLQCHASACARSISN